MIVQARKTHSTSLTMHVWSNANKEVRAIKSLNTVALVEEGVVLQSFKGHISAKVLKMHLGCIPVPHIISISL